MASTGGLRIEDAPNGVRPICPHCKQELATVWTISKRFALMGAQRILLCPHCRAVLGYAAAVS